MHDPVLLTQPPSPSPAEEELARAKAAMRARARARRAAVAAGPEAAGQAGTGLLAALAPVAGERVAGYRAIGSEFDPHPILIELERQGARLCLPVVTGAGRPLGFRSWHAGAPLQRGAFGVDIPAAGVDCRPTRMIVPLLAWDRSGARLGYGGGYYDRTLAGLRRAGHGCRAVGLAWAAQEVPAIPCGPADARLDALVTENEWIVWSR